MSKNDNEQIKQGAKRPQVIGEAAQEEKSRQLGETPQCLRASDVGSGLFAVSSVAVVILLLLFINLLS